MLGIRTEFQRYLDIQKRERDIRDWAHKEGISPQEIHAIYPWSDTALISTEKRVLIFFDTHSSNDVRDSHVCIYASPWNTVYEKKEYAHQHLRGGLSNEEQKQLLDVIRRISVCVLCNEEEKIKGLQRELEQSPRFSEACSLDVAVWLDGELRGSQVSDGRPLSEGVVDATRRTLKDKRFKPIRQEELPSCVFECFVVPSPWLSLRKRDVCMDRPYADHTYKVVHQMKTGWYFPAVANILRVQNTDSFLNSLIHQKTGIPLKEKRRTCVYSAQSIGFAEDVHTSQGWVALHGPVTQADTQIDLSTCKARLWHHIEKNIDEEGYVCPVITPDMYQKNNLDLVRHAFLYKSLVECMDYEGGERYATSIRRLRTFFEIVAGGDYARPPLHARLYFADGCRREGDIKTAQKIAGDPLLKEISLDTFLENVQILLAQQYILEKDCTADINRMYDFWLEYKGKISLASVPDLILLLQEAGKRDAVHELLMWFLECQNEDGSFPNVPGSNYVYTRGTAKIAESFANIPEAKDMVEKALFWVASMQYTETDYRFVREENRELVLGGIRHDYWNKDVWTDSASHMHLALSRVGVR